MANLTPVPMPAFLPPPAASGRRVFAALLLALLTCAGALHAQVQEGGTMDRILHPDRTLKYSDADHKFDAPAAAGSKQAIVRPYPFSHPAAVKAGDGVFRTRDFNSKSYRTRDFATKPAATKDFDKTGKTYAVRAVAVNEDRAAGKTMDTHGYVPAGKPYLERGKRQDTIDEIPDAKKMTIDQVRELLNKPK
jgi:hypothetical protein